MKIVFSTVAAAPAILGSNFTAGHVRLIHCQVKVALIESHLTPFYFAFYFPFELNIFARENEARDLSFETNGIVNG